jgi:DNA-binding NtrC family response regulator
MGERRVLLATEHPGDEVAATLRDAGFVVERCAPTRLSRALAEGGAALVVVEDVRATPGWAAAPDAPAWLALCPDERACVRALEAGAAAAATTPALLAVHARRVASAQRERSEALAALARQADEDAWVLVGTSPSAQRLHEALARVASTPRTTVLVRGRAGAPLDELARLVHARSARARGPRIDLDAAEASAERLDEAFGLDGGSVIVREIALLDEVAQAALAQRLEPRSGAGADGMRLIATTTRELSAEVESGRMREDLAYRLNVLTLAVPALEERRQDLPRLAERLAARAARALGRSPARIDASLRDELARRPWPGDLLELSLYMTARELSGAEPAGGPASPPAALPALGTPESLVIGDRSLRAVEEALIRRVLEETGGNKLRTAEILGIHRTTLYHKLAHYGLGESRRL